MRRPLAGAKWVVGALALVGVALGSSAASGAPTANVFVDAAGLCKGKTPCYTTIQAGVDAAAPGNVVLVYRGTYHEHVVVAEPVTLRGDGDPIITADGAGVAITITASGATVTRFRLQNGEIGLWLQGNWGGAASDNLLGELRISGFSQGMLFSGSATDNVVRDIDVTGSAVYGINVGDTGNTGNQFLHLKLHRNPGKGFNAYGGSNGTVLKDSKIERNGDGGVQIGWSGGWTIEHNEIVDNVGMGVLTDAVWTGSIAHNYIVGNTQAGVGLSGPGSAFVVVQDNRIERNALSGIYLNQAVYNTAQHNMIAGNGAYGVEITDHPFPNYSNSITGNFLFSGSGALGDAVDNRVSGPSNSWSGNYYSGNMPWVAPFLVPGLGGAMDAAPLTQAALPKPATKADCRKDGWWLLTNGTAPFANEGKCLAFLK